MRSGQGGGGPAAGVLAGLRSRAAGLHLGVDLSRLFAEAFEREWEARRLFLWLPVLAGAGVLLDLSADHEPAIWFPALIGAGAAAGAWAARERRAPFLCAVAAAAIFAGFTCAQWRSMRVGGPVLDRVRIVGLRGFVEEVDHRRRGSRFILSVTEAMGIDPAIRLGRVRLTTRRDDPLEAGDYVSLKARLLPPAAAALPGGYSFARDAYFMGFQAVGSALGRIGVVPAAGTPSPVRAALRAVDRARNALAGRVSAILGGDRGAIAAAMVTGKRDLLSDEGRELIREAGIFHIVTIAGVQMTLVAGLLFGLVRRGLALSPALALRHPIKKWAAGAAIVGAVAYDVFTGSRIGTQRALFMTLIVLGAVLVDRRGLTMRNLALAALAVILFEPESITGASFQLSFAAVAALIAVYEARQRRAERVAADPRAPRRAGRLPGWWRAARRGLEHAGHLLAATLFATAATSPFMAGNFHELSPYVFIGNPLTLSMIEFFAVPGALLGSVLYPLGLDTLVWHWVGTGIAIVLWVARFIAAAPGSTIFLPAFAPWAMPVLALAVLSAVIWRTLPFRLTAVPLALIGLGGALSGPRYDMLVLGSGDAVAVRGPDGRLAVVGRAGDFTVEQWLRADGDGRTAAGPVEGARCDRLACIAPLPGGQTLSLVADSGAFAEDCRRVDVIVTRLQAPSWCGASLIVDRTSLALTGALGLTLRNGGWVPTPARAILEDRPWSPAPRPALPRPPFPARDDAATTKPADDDPPQAGGTAD